LCTFSQADRAYSRASRLAAKGEYDKAAAAFDEVIQRRPSDRKAYLQRALSLSDAGKYAAAIQSAEKAAELAPWNPAPHVFIGRIHYDHGRYDRALASFDRALHLNPQNNLAQAYRGLALLAMGRSKQAKDVLGDLSMPTNSAFEGRLLAFCEAELANHADARSLEDQIAEKDKPSRGATARSASEAAENAIGRWRSAWYRVAAALRHPLSRDLRRAAWHACFGDRLAALEEWKLARREYEAALRLAPEWHAVRFGLAHTMLAEQRYGDALRELKAVGEAVPETLELHGALGMAFYGDRNFGAALKHFKVVTEDSRRDFLPAYYCGMCAVHMGDGVAARRWFERAAGMVNPHIARERLRELLRVVGSQ
jgi:tetratricopeptide (TPR) repeat protein